MKTKFNGLKAAIERNYLRAGVAATAAMASAGAFAQTDPFDTALSEISTKVEGYGGALVGLAAVTVVFFVAIKYVKKINHAA
jgi:type IV secretory pathway VirB2 component (pilin)